MGTAGREVPHDQRADRRGKPYMGPEHARKASELKVSVQPVMRGQGVAWLKLHCLKPSLLVVSPQACACWLKRTQRRCAEACIRGICTLSSPLSGEDAPRKR